MTLCLQVERVATAPRVKITDAGELADRQRVKRKGFEDDIRKNRTKMTNWIKYAAWEENQREYDRARYTFLEPSGRFIPTVSMMYILGLYITVSMHKSVGYTVKPKKDP